MFILCIHKQVCVYTYIQTYLYIYFCFCLFFLVKKWASTVLYFVLFQTDFRAKGNGLWTWRISWSSSVWRKGPFRQREQCVTDILWGMRESSSICQEGEAMKHTSVPSEWLMEGTKAWPPASSSPRTPQRISWGGCCNGSTAQTLPLPSPAPFTPVYLSNLSTRIFISESLSREPGLRQWDMIQEQQSWCSPCHVQVESPPYWLCNCSYVLSLRFLPITWGLQY